MEMRLLLTALLLLGACHDPRPGTLWNGSVGLTGNGPGSPGYTCVDPAVTDEFVAAGYSGVDVLLIVDSSGSMEEEQANLAANFQTFIDEADGANYRIGVTTMDRDRAGLLHGYPPVIYQDTFEGFAKNVAVGVMGSNVEQGLECAQLSLKVAYNKYLRDDAVLVLIFVSNEDDQSFGTLSSYVDDFAAWKPGKPEMLQGL